MNDRWIKKGWEYRRVYREGTKQVGKGVIAYLCCHGAQTMRFGLTVSGRVGKAVVRNRIKRILREIVRKRLAGWPARGELVLVARPEIAGWSYWDIQDEVLRVVGRLSRRLGVPEPGDGGVSHRPRERPR